jgi:hypothetical protein
MTVFIARRLQWARWYAYHLSVDVRCWEAFLAGLAGGRPN